MPRSGDKLRSPWSLFTRGLTAMVPDVLASLHAEPDGEFRARLGATYSAIDPDDARRCLEPRRGDGSHARTVGRRLHLDVPCVRYRIVLTLHNWWRWDHVEHGELLDWGWHDAGGTYERAISAEALALSCSAGPGTPWVSPSTAPSPPSGPRTAGPHPPPASRPPTRRSVPCTRRSPPRPPPGCAAGRPGWGGAHRAARRRSGRPGPPRAAAPPGCARRTPAAISPASGRHGPAH